MKFRKINLFVATLVIACAGQADATWTPPGKITYVHPWPTGFSFIIDGQSGSCSNGSNQFFVEWAADPVSKQLYALVLSAFYSGDHIAASWFCDSNGNTITKDIDLRKAP